MGDYSQFTEKEIDPLSKYVADLIIMGFPFKQIVSSLISSGVDKQSAELLVLNILYILRDPIQKAGRKKMFFGAFWCIGGIIVTAITYFNASGGGTYIVAWGAILFGGIQFIRGLDQYLKVRIPK